MTDELGDGTNDAARAEAEAGERRRIAERLKLKVGQHARVIPGVSALELADLTGVQRDMELVGDACRIIVHRGGSPSTDALRRACLDSAVMRYRRAFNGGKRKGLPDDIVSRLTPDEWDLHPAETRIDSRRRYQSRYRSS